MLYLVLLNFILLLINAIRLEYCFCKNYNITWFVNCIILNLSKVAKWQIGFVYCSTWQLTVRRKLWIMHWKPACLWFSEKADQRLLKESCAPTSPPPPFSLVWTFIRFCCALKDHHGFLSAFSFFSSYEGFPLSDEKRGWWNHSRK